MLGFFVILGFNFSQVNGQSITDLEKQIQERARIRQELEQEAAKIKKELNTTGAEKGVLQAELNRINRDRADIDGNIRQTREKISELSGDIKRTEQQINAYSEGIDGTLEKSAGLLRRVYQQDSATFFESLFSLKRFSELFVLRDSYLLLQPELQSLVTDLSRKQISLRKTNQELSKQQETLSQEQVILADQRDIVKEKELEQKNILGEVQKKESSIKQTLSKALNSIATLDAEIRSFESRLKFELNPNSLPEKGSEAFAWPLKKVLVTQRFGRTVSSERLYVSGSHSGVDFRAAVGTPVYSVADGVVVGIGNTDDTCPKASFGKWVFIEHNIGLSTTYGHLSSQKVSPGQRVKKGQLIGYSGNTGRSTAPHLHLTTYATKGVDGGDGARITNRPSGACSGKTYRIPLAPTAAYLDPLAYLPKTDSSFFKHN